MSFAARPTALFLLFAFACAGAPPPDEPAFAEGVITEAQLLREMVDPTSVSRLPATRFTAHLASSFDRRSLAGPESPEWFANYDTGHYERLEENVAVLMDVEGPGAIVRLWSAKPFGRIRIYVNHEEIPRVDADLRELLHGHVAPFTTPFGFVASYGYNLYYPIPFDDGCRVTVELPDPTQPLFYQVNYRRYEEGTRVRGSNAADPELEPARAAARAALEDGAFADGALTTMRHDRLGDGSLVIDADPEGSVVRAIRIDAPLDDAALRATLLTIRFDGEETVRVPLGDFFGTGPGRRDVTSLLTTTTAEGALEARFPMPFAETLELALDPPREEVSVELDLEAQPFDERSLYFHAHYRAPVRFLTTDATGTPIPYDHNVADIEGEGVLIGTVLNVANERWEWWGEGDEKIFIDGETFPRFFGTGTEDYFGYAYCSTQPFDAPYIGHASSRQTDNRGYISLYRWLIPDAIPFTTSLRFDFEVLHSRVGGDESFTTLDAITYFYARPGAVELGPVPTVDDLVIPSLPEFPEDMGTPRVCGSAIPPDP